MFLLRSQGAEILGFYKIWFQWNSFARWQMLNKNPFLSFDLILVWMSKSNSASTKDCGIRTSWSNIYGPACSKGIRSLSLTSFQTLSFWFLYSIVAISLVSLISFTGWIIGSSVISLTMSPGFIYWSSKDS